MLSVTTTPHLYGITLKGDYLDLNELYDSLSRYLLFYQENEDTFPYYEYEYLLSLNYDIRHAYMGTRNFSFEENNASGLKALIGSIYDGSPETSTAFSEAHQKSRCGNLYFSEDILYPLAFHYLITFEKMLDRSYLPGRYYRQSAELPEYDRITAVHDRAVIANFTTLLWQNLSNLFADTKGCLYDTFINKPAIPRTPSIYIDGLLHWQLVHFKTLDDEGKKAFLLSVLYELLDTTKISARHTGNEIPSRADAMRTLRTAGLTFPTKNRFFSMLERNVPDGQPLYHDVFDAILDKNYGKISERDEYPEM